MAVDNIKVILDGAELLQASFIGCYRCIQSTLEGSRPAYGIPENQNWQRSIEGAIGELAVAKATNTYWNGDLYNIHKGTLKAPDVGRHQVRTTTHQHGALILHKEDEDNDIFVLVTGRERTYFVRGWIHGIDGKQPEYWEDRSGKMRPAYFVDQDLLKPIHTLPK